MKELSHQSRFRLPGAILPVLLLFFATNLPAAQLWEKLLADFEIKILPVATNLDHSVDYLKHDMPRPLRYQARVDLSHAEARALLPPLVVDDPDTGRTNVAMQTSYRPNPGAEKNKEDSAKAAEENPPAQGPAFKLKKVAKPPPVVKPVSPLAATPDKVTFVESPPPARQLAEEERRRRELATQLRSLVPYFINSRGSNPGTAVGVTNNVVPFAPPQINP